ncbi:hypothetical protein DL239_02705 [Sedimentitalea sp. CY04]|uniref:YCII-related domain-containing protein n=1 Tax=Parasedimentitalea denitrificans TaxID=2211118 RepID=A0ABX0W2M0_9RHOB|nr:YciI family protein [Sedimentitalea sp. CY04]NIZ59882.1 hypothetical protein [Sedimentitalea sp. CY04]
MVRWVVIFKDSEAMLAVRAERKLRDAHVAFARAHPELRIGGGLKPDPDSAFCGAMWVVEVADKDAVERLISADPFYFPEHRTYEIYAWGKILEDQSVVL